MPIHKSDLIENIETEIEDFSQESSKEDVIDFVFDKLSFCQDREEKTEWLKRYNALVTAYNTERGKKIYNTLK